MTFGTSLDTVRLAELPRVPELSEPFTRDTERLPAPEPGQATMTVTVQITLPRQLRTDSLDGAVLGQQGAEPLDVAALLAERLHVIAASRARELTPDAGVSTTVSMVTRTLGAVTLNSSPTAPEQRSLPRPPALPPTQRTRGLPRLAFDVDAGPVGLVAAVEPASEVVPALRIVECRREALLDGKPLALTRREYELVSFLASRPGRVFTRRQLLNWVWGEDVGSGERTVDVHVRRLRAKLHDRGPVITTIRGVGYRLDQPERVSVQ